MIAPESLLYIIKQIITFLDNTKTLPDFTDAERRFMNFRTKKSGVVIDAWNPSDGEVEEADRSGSLFSQPSLMGEPWPREQETDH